MNKTKTSPPPPPDKQDIAAVVALLRKHKSFAMAASYDLNVLYPSLSTSDDVERVVQTQGIPAVLACLENVRAATAAGSTLLESASRVLCRCLALLPQTVAPLVLQANGVALVVRALRDGDDHRPVEALQFLGLVADAGYEDSIRAAQGGELLVQLLMLKEEEEARCQAMLALGKVARASLSCEVMLPEASRRALLADTVIASLIRDGGRDDGKEGGDGVLMTPPSNKGSSINTAPSPLLTRSSSSSSTTTGGGSSNKRNTPPSQQQQQQHQFYSTTTTTSSSSSSSSSSFRTADVLHAHISILVWLITTSADHGSRGDLTNKMATAGLASLLLQHIQSYENEASGSVPPTLLSLCGQLLFLVVEGPLLEQALQATASAPKAGSLPPAMCLAVVSSIALCAEGRRAIVGEKDEEGKEEGKAGENVLGSLLWLCQADSTTASINIDDYFTALLTALRTLERLAADPTHANELLHRKTMDAAMQVLNRATTQEEEGEDTREDGGEEGVVVIIPGDVIAAATSLVARLTEMVMLLNSNDDDQHQQQQQHRRTSFGSTTTDTKLQALRCALAAFARHPESELLFGSVVELALSSLRSTRTAASALDALWRLVESTEGAALPRNQRVELMRERVWSERGLAACVAAMRDLQKVVGGEEGEGGSGSSSSSNGEGENEVQDKTCRLLARVLPASAPSQDRRKSMDALVFRLQCFPGLEELCTAVEGMERGGGERLELESEKAAILAFVRPVFEARKQQQQQQAVARRSSWSVAELGIMKGGKKEEEVQEKGVVVVGGTDERAEGGAEHQEPLRVGLREIAPERLEMDEEVHAQGEAPVAPPPHVVSLSSSSSSASSLPARALAAAALLDIPDVPTQATTAPSPSPPPPRALQPDDDKRQEVEQTSSASRNPPPPPPPPSLPPLPPAPAWLQVVHAQGRIYFVNTETGCAQYELPPELPAWWELQAHRRAAATGAAVAAGAVGGEEGEGGEEEEEVLCEMPGWTAKVGACTRMVFFVPRRSGGGGGEGGGGREGAAEAGAVGRRYRLPADVPAGFLGAGTLRGPGGNTAGGGGGAAASSDGGMSGAGENSESESKAKAKEKEEEEAEARVLLNELGKLQKDMAEEAACLTSGTTKTQSSVPLSQTYAALLRRIKKRSRAFPSSSSSSSSGMELEEGLCDALRKALERIEDTSNQLSYYKDLYKHEKTAHERKGDIAGLEATMALVKGEVLQHTPEELPRIAKVLAQIERNPTDGPELLLKEAHLLIKRIVLRVGGEQKADTIWALTLPALDNIPDHFMHQLRDQLRVLVIAYDNLTLQQKARLKTASEIVKNRSWLVQLAVRCAEHGQVSASERSKTALINTRLTPPAVGHGTGSSGGRTNSSSSSSTTGSASMRRASASPRGSFSSPTTAKFSRTTTTTTPPASSTSTSKSSAAVRRPSLDGLATPKRPFSVTRKTGKSASPGATTTPLHPPATHAALNKGASK